MTLYARKRAPTLVSLAHRPLHIRRNVVRIRTLLRARRPRLAGSCELLLLDLTNARSEALIEQRLEVRLTAQLLEVPQLIVRALPDTDTNLEPLSGDGCNS